MSSAQSRIQTGNCQRPDTAAIIHDIVHGEVNDSPTLQIIDLDERATSAPRDANERNAVTWRNLTQVIGIAFGFQRICYLLLAGDWGTISERA